MTPSIPATNICDIICLPGLTAYADALALQYNLVRQRQAGTIPDTLVLLEHPPTITLGRAADNRDFITPRAELERRGITVVDTDRGGEITYHAPGQLVGYPVLDLRGHGQDLHIYLRQLEDVLIQTLGVFGINAGRIPTLTGVWVNNQKIAAIGIKASRWVTMHGFALNINLDLRPLREDFVPCGIRDRGVTSMIECQPGVLFTRQDVETVIIDQFCRVFSVKRGTAQPGILPP